MAGAQRSIEVNVSPEDFFKVISDYEKYVDFIPEMKRIRVVRRDGNTAEVDYQVQVEVGGIAAKTVNYTLRHVEDAPRGLKWSMVKGEMMKSSDGSWTVESLGPNRVKATYWVDVGFGLLVPKSVSAALTERSLPKLLEAFKARAESLSGKGA